MSGVGSRTKVLFGVLVLLLLTVLWYLFIFSPKNEAIAAAEVELDNAVLRESTLRTRIAQLQAIKDNELSYLFAIGQMESSIPTTPQADAFIEDMTFLAETTGVELTAITLTPPVADPLTGGFEVPVAISIEGEYFEILGFLYGVEALDRLVRVDSIGLTPMAADDDEEAAPPPETNDDGSVVESRVRPNPDRLAAAITLRIFTRSPAAGSSEGSSTTVPQGSAEIDDGAGENI
ncbi:MAG: type 4a pilus biogenesis protein PilO [bacterium]|nr:type 4a pilus biogenesis protein PilO [bacterium]